MSVPSAGEPATTAHTDPRSPDPRLRGRTYAIFFDRVWRASCELADGGLRRWHILHADDEAGVIEAQATSLVLRVPDRVHVSVGLDENAQTRVDVTVTSPKPGSDLGRGRRVVSRFFQRLDARIGAAPTQILDASRPPFWSA